MKKYLYLVFALVAMSSVFYSCSQENESNETSVVKQEEFKMGIEHLISEQVSIINHQHVSRMHRVKDSQSMLEVKKDIARQLDSTSIVFVYQNVSPIKEFVPIVELTEDEKEIMAIDADVLMKHIKDNYSDNVYNIVYYSSNGYNTTSPEFAAVLEKSLSSNNPLDQLFAANAIVKEEFDKSFTSENVYYGSDKEDRDRQNCDDIYKSEIANCEYYIWNGLVSILETTITFAASGATLGAFVGGTWNLGTLSIPSATLAGGVCGTAGLIGQTITEWDRYQKNVDCKERAEERRRKCYAEAARRNK